MFTRFFTHTLAPGFLALLILLLAACAPIVPVPQTGAEPTQPVDPALPAGGLSGLDADEILIQLTYEPGFVMPEYRFPFSITPPFTLLADGRVIYVDENQEFRVMQVRLTADEAAALLNQVRGLGFERLESHTDLCGKMADGSEACIADASTSVLWVRMETGSLRELRNYANFSNDPAAYEAIYNLLDGYTHPEAAVYVPHAATLFVRIVPPGEMPSLADWPLDPAYVQRAQRTADQLTAVVLSAEEAALWQKNVGIDNNSITFQLDGTPVAGMFVPWLPGQDFSAEIAAEFPGQ